MNKLMFKEVAQKEDIKAVADLAKVIWTEHYTPIIGSEQVGYMLEKFQSIKAIEKAVSTGEMKYYLLETHSGYAGYAGISIDEKGLFLSKIYILTAMRGKGYAREALNFAEQLAQEHKADKIWLTCNVDNKDTLSKYESLGFVKTETVKSDIGGGYYMDDYILEKTLLQPIL